MPIQARCPEVVYLDSGKEVNLEVALGYALRCRIIQYVRLLINQGLAVCLSISDGRNDWVLHLERSSSIDPDDEQVLLLLPPE